MIDDAPIWYWWAWAAMLVVMGVRHVWLEIVLPRWRSWRVYRGGEPRNEGVPQEAPLWFYYVWCIGLVAAALCYTFL